MSKQFALLAALLLAGIVRAITATQPSPALSPATTIHEAGMVDIRSQVPDLSHDIRYFGSDNFVGAPIGGNLLANPSWRLVPGTDSL